LHPIGKFLIKTTVSVFVSAIVSETIKAGKIRLRAYKRRRHREQMCDEEDPNGQKK